MSWVAYVARTSRPFLCPRGPRPVALLGAVAAMLLFSLSPLSVAAATIPVGGGCSLADALTAANTNAVSGGCASGAAGPDTIVLQASATYTLTSVDNTGAVGPTGLPAITSEIVVQGNGASIERGSGPSLRLLRVASGGTLTLDNVNLRYADLGNGSAFDGGAILVESGGSAVITDTLFDTNGGRQGGGLFVASGGAATVTTVTFRGNYAWASGGAIGNDGTLMLQESAVTGNYVTLSGTHGGGIASTGSLTVRRTTIRDSEAPRGAGISSAATTELTNTTITRNRARTAGGGGLEAAGGTVTIRNSTIVQNGAVSAGGGILTSAGTVLLTNTIVAANATGAPTGNWDTGSLVAAGSDCSGAVTSNGHNLVGQGTGCPSGGSGDTTEPPASVLTRVLGPLANNGGLGFTYHPKPSSPVVSAGDAATCGAAPVGGIDQRGRPRGGSCDIGAVEGAYGTIAVTGGCTLIDAIVAANTDAPAGGCPAGNGADTIDVQAPGPFTLTAVNNTAVIIGPSGLPAVTSMIRIQGGGRVVERGSSAPSFRIFVVRDGGDLTLDGLTVRNGRLDDGRGAGVGVFGGFLTLVNAEVSGNTSASGTPNSFGGGIAVEVSGEFSDAQLILTNSVVRNNQADFGAGISHLRRVTIDGSTIEGNTARFQGGGIFALAPLTVTNSTIRGNQATEPGNALTRSSTGGGISASGTATLTVTGSTISSNSAISGGGIYVIAGSSLSTIANSTISGNSSIGPAETDPSGNFGGFAGAGIEVMRSPGGLALINSTVADNRATDASGTGGILIGHFGGTSSTVTLSNTLVAGNRVAGNVEAPRADCATGPSAGPNVTSAGSNVVGQGTGCPTDGTGDRTVVPADTFGSVLGPLANNGGPTQTHALLDGSPAIDAGDPAVCGAAPVNGVDQRGIARARCDVGAFEGGAAGPPPGSPIVVNAVCTLIEAIEAANRDAPFGGCSAGLGADTIVLAAGSTHTLTAAYETAVDPGPNGLPTITSDITIEGNAATIQRVAAESVRFRIFFVADGAALKLRDVTVRGGRTADLVGVGGGIYVRGATARLTLEGVTVRDNVASGEGGGIANGSTFIVGAGPAGTVTATGSTVTANTATTGGGGIASGGGTVTLADTTVSGNFGISSVVSFGGGILVGDGTSFTMTGGTIASNSAVGGGGLFVSRGRATLTGVTVSVNRATGGGGGIDNRAILRLVNSTVSGNTAATSGGGIANLFQNTSGAEGGMTLEGSTVSGNTASAGGGGIVTYGPATLTNSIVENNTAARAGGGILLSTAKPNDDPTSIRATTLTMTGGDVRNNTANGSWATDGGGGGIANGSSTANPPGTVTLTGVTVSGNRAPNGDGGGIMSRGALSVDGGTVSGNSSSSGAGISAGSGGLSGGAITLANAVVRGNTAAAYGGGIFVLNGGALTATGGALLDNRGYLGGGLAVFPGTGAVTLTGVAVLANNGGERGGGIWHAGPSLTLTDVTVGAATDSPVCAASGLPSCGNTSIYSGGGLQVVGPGNAVILERTTVAANRVTEGSGGGISNGIHNSPPTHGGTLTIRNSTIQGNSTIAVPGTTGAAGGGGIAAIGGRTELIDSTVSGNRVTAPAGVSLFPLGGGIMGAGFTNVSTEIVVTTSTFDGNVLDTPGRPSAGGGINAQHGTTLTVTGSTLSANRAAEGGGLFVGAGATGTVTDTTIRANVAGRGAGVTVLLGSLTLDKTTVSENEATAAGVASFGHGGGIANVGGTLLLRNGSAVTNNRADGPFGGGIANLLAGGAPGNQLTVRASLVQGNQATNGRGGGLYNETAATILDSTVSGNLAALDGGGIASVTSPGGATFTVAGSTVADNRAGGVGGGISTEGAAAHVRNAIVAGNQQGGSPIAGNADCAGPLTSDGHNLVGQGTGCPAGGTGDLQAAPGSIFSAVLRPLADNGGPTPTHALVSGSPAIDAGNPSPAGAGDPFGCSDTDQRGSARPTDGNGDGTPRCDIGAFEATTVALQSRCAPRPNVVLTAVPTGAGRLDVTVKAGTSAATPTNSIRQLRIAAPPTVVIDVVGGPNGATGAVEYSPPPGAPEVRFVVRRVAPGPVQVPFVVVDECGDWPTFVGGGPGAF